VAIWFILVLAGLPILLKMLDAGSHRRCRSCASDVRREAKLCPACGQNPKVKPVPVP
jgi:predicted amidophosphoribosyltransferase